MRALLTATWFFHVILSAGAGYAMLRLWFHRHHPLMGRIGLYMIGFVVEGALDTVMLSMTRDSRTAMFVAIWIAGTWIRDLPRMPLIIFLIRGPGDVPAMAAKTSGDQDPSFWLTNFNRIVRRHTRQHKRRQRNR